MVARDLVIDNWQIILWEYLGLAFAFSSFMENQCLLSFVNVSKSKLPKLTISLQDANKLYFYLIEYWFFATLLRKIKMNSTMR